jgi:hypothetical protein
MPSRAEQSRPLRAIGLVCTLKPDPASSSSELITEQLFTHLEPVGVECQAVRCVDLNLLPGVGADMGPATSRRRC